MYRQQRLKIKQASNLPKEVTRNLDKEKSKKKKEDSFCKLRRPIKGDGGVSVNFYFSTKANFPFHF